MSALSDSALSTLSSGLANSIVSDGKISGPELTAFNQDVIDSKINKDQINVPNGVAGLNGSGTINSGLLPTTASPISVTLKVASKLYAVVGVQFNLYWEDIVHASVPMSALGVRFGDGNANGYGVGYMLEECWRWTPVTGDIGSHTFDINVYYADAIVATKSVTFVVVAASQGSGTKKVLMIGDSTTTGAMAVSQLVSGGSYAADSITFSHIGTQDSDPKKNEGHSGWSTTTFNTTGSPFWIGGAFNFSGYLSANSLSMSAGDWVWINLGINDIFAASPITPDYAGITTMWQTMITSIHAYNANINVGIGLTFSPQNVFNYMQSNGALFDGYTYMKRLAGLHAQAVSIFDTSGQRTAKVFMVNTHACMDKSTGFDTVTAAKHSRDTGTYVRKAEFIHPNTVGYKQIWDCMYAAIKCNS